MGYLALRFFDRVGWGRMVGCPLPQVNRDMTKNEQLDVIDRLKSYKKQFDDLLTQFEDLPLPPEGKDKAQQMLKTLKDSLKSDYKEGRAVRRRQQMTQAEVQYFYPAVHEAHADIHIRWNTVPNEQWRSELYGARINITHVLHQLEG